MKNNRACLSGMVLWAGVLMVNIAAATERPAPSGSGGEVTKQPVFVLSPHKERYSAWSLYLLTDRSDPSKVHAIGLEKLLRVNSKDMTYEEVLQAQRNPKTETEKIQELPAAEFGRGMLEVEKDDALDVSVTPAGKNTLELMLSMRVSADKRFIIGGKEVGKRKVVLKYDEGRKGWFACAERLKSVEGADLARGGCEPLTGIAFPVTGTGIYRVVGVLENGEAVELMDRTR